MFHKVQVLTFHIMYDSTFYPYKAIFQNITEFFTLIFNFKWKLKKRFLSWENYWFLHKKSWGNKSLVIKWFHLHIMCGAVYSLYHYCKLCQHIFTFTCGSSIHKVFHSYSLPSHIFWSWEPFLGHSPLYGSGSFFIVDESGGCGRQWFV